MNVILLILLLLASSVAYPQPISHQNWQTVVISGDSISVSCAELILPYEKGDLLVESDPTASRGEMDESLRSPHPIKISLQPETGTSDQITNITGCTTNGATIKLATVDVGDTVTVVHTPGVIEFVGGSSVVLDTPIKILTLHRKGGIWVSDGGIGGGSGFVEDMGTQCPTGQYPISDGAGSLYCGEVPYVLDDCSWVSSTWTLCWDYPDRIMYRGTGTAAKAVNFVPRASDCGLYPDVGDLCIDTDDGNLYRGSPEGEVLVGGGGGSGSQSLNSAFDIGKVIDGADSEANAMVVGNGTDGFKFYVGTTGPIMKCFQGAGTCDITLDIPTGKSFKIKYNGVDGITVSDSGNVTLANNMIIYKSFWFGAGALATDGTNCVLQADRQINGGPKVSTVKCLNNTSSTLYGNAGLPDGYNGGAVNFEIQGVNEYASPAGTTLNMAISAMCRHAGDTMNATWGTAVSAGLTFNTQYVMVHSNTVTVTPNGTCTPGEHLFWRAVLTTATTQMDNVYLFGVKMEYPTSDWSDQ